MIQVHAGGDGTNGNGNGAGRAAHRGGARGDVRPGAGAVPAVTQQLAQLSVGTGDASAQRSGRRAFSYQEPNTRPAHLTDKKGQGFMYFSKKNSSKVIKFKFVKCTNIPYHIHKANFDS